MQNSDNRIHNKRTFQGEDQVLPLVNWLNHTRDTAARDRIIRIMGLFEELVLNVREQMEGPKRLELLRFYNDEINDSLSYYALVPEILVVPGGSNDKGLLLTSWIAAPDTELERQNPSVPRPKTIKGWQKHASVLADRGMREIDALLRLLDLIKTRDFWRLGFCRGTETSPCGTFFFAKFRNQRFCSDRCRVAEFRNDEEARAKRNAYARDLYHKHKTKNLK